MRKVIYNIINALKKGNTVRILISYDISRTMKRTNSIIGEFISEGVVQFGDFSELYFEDDFTYGYLMHVDRIKVVDCMRICFKYKLKKKILDDLLVS